ncbi:MAG TPA: substrate-binding domain-containing protein, partial [Bacteroidota bacterium]|nr:substrate-binding domain-containing protein [Bacteroidota bacterium]
MQKDLLRRSRRIVTVLSLIACLIMMAGCGERRAETPTRGRVTFSVSEEVLPLLRTAETRFEELYPEAEITLRPRPDREAIGDLFNDSVKLIVTARAMNAEEKAIQKKFNIEVNEFRIALDAVAIIVNNANDVTRLTLPGADSIFTGASMDWGLLGWNGSPGKINVYLPDKNSAACEVVAGRLPGLKPGRRGYTAPKKVCLTSRELISAVESDPAGIGIVGLNWMRNNTAAVRVVELSDPSAPESLGISGKYFAP